MPKRARSQSVNWDGLVGDIYDCAANTAHWPSVLGKIEQSTQGYAGVLHSLDRSLGIKAAGSVLIEHNTDPEWSEQYRAYYAKLNPERRCVDELPLFKAYTNDGLFGWNVFIRSPYHNEYRVPQGFGDSVNMLIERTPERTVSISIFRPATEAIFRKADLAFLDRLAPHLNRSARLAGMLSHEAAPLDRLSEMLDRLQLGVVVLAHDFRVIRLNSAAKAMLDSRIFTLRQDKTLSLPGRHDNAWLRQLLTTRNFEDCRQFLTADGQPINITSMFFDHVVTGCPFFRDASNAFCFLFFRAAQRAHTGDDCALFAKAYGLTQAETTVLSGILGGKTLVEIGDSLGIQRSTVKTHLGRIFLKTDTNRQVDLICKAGKHSGASG